MDFIDFAAAHGLIINHVEIGKITRCKTVSHRSKKNGAYYYEGDFGWCMDWSVHNKPEIWITDKEVDRIELQKKIRKSQDSHNKERARINQQAIKKAGDMLGRCRNDVSAYLAKKGFPEMCFNMLFEEGEDELLCVPMRVDGKLSGLQTIKPDGSKKFIYGTGASYATFDIGQGSTIFLVEGLASGFTLQQVSSKIKVPYTIKVCFSAGNMAKVASKLSQCYLVLDNDKSGTSQRVGAESGKPFYLPEMEGEDINDEVNRVGIFKISMKIKQMMYK